MERKSPDECASKLLEAVHLFINHSVQNYIETGMIRAYEKPALMREFMQAVEQKLQEYTRLSQTEQAQVSSCTFE